MKKGSIHTQAHHVSFMKNGESPLEVDDEFPYATFFQVKMVSKWSERVIHFLTIVKVKALGDNVEEQVDFMLACFKFPLILG